MTADLCELTELPQAMCAHCRGLTRLTREEYVRRYKARLAGGDDAGLVHGETTTLYEYGCRCSPCCGAWTETQDRSRLRNGRVADRRKLPLGEVGVGEQRTKERQR